ncbi:MAG: hypothetical protein ABW321_16900 [Polyangiales bacterium]
MRKQWETTSGYAAAPALLSWTIAWTFALVSAVSACGPQTVPYPIGGRPASAARNPLPPPVTALAGNNAAAAGRGGSRPETPARGQTPSSPPRGAAGTPAITTPSGPIAAQGGSSAPPPSAAGGSAAPTTPITPSEPAQPSTGIDTPSDVPFDAGTDPARNEVQPGSLCARIAAIQCAGEAHCCSMPGSTVERCTSELTSACRDTLYLDTIASNPVTGFDRNATRTFLDELERRSEACDPEVGAWFISPQGLRGILKGTIGPGASCKPPGADLSNRPVMAAALGSCQQSETHACLPGSLLGNWTCEPKGGAGSNCATDDNCLAGLFCEDADPLGRCAQRRQVGAECTEGLTECSSLYCSNERCVPPDAEVAFCLE